MPPLARGGGYGEAFSGVILGEVCWFEGLLAGWDKSFVGWVLVRIHLSVFRSVSLRSSQLPFLGEPRGKGSAIAGVTSQSGSHLTAPLFRGGEG